MPKTPDGAVEDFAEGLLVLREDLRGPVLRSRGATRHAALTAAACDCSASVPGAPGGTGFALAARWRGALTWRASGARRPLDDYLRESLRTLISMLLRSPSPHQKPAP